MSMIIHYIIVVQNFLTCFPDGFFNGLYGEAHL